VPNIDTSTASLCLKHFYLPVFVVNVYESSALFHRCEKTARYCYGDYAIIGRQTSRNMGSGPVGTEGGEFPVPGSIGFKQPTVYMKLQGSTMRISWTAMMVSKDKRGAYVPLLTHAMKDMEASMKWELARQWWGNGSGILAYLMSADTDKTDLAVDDGQTNQPDGDGSYRHFLRPGMRVNHYDLSLNDESGAVKTVQENTTGHTVTLDADLGGTPADGHTLRRESSVGGDPITAYYDCMGMDGIVSADDPVTGDFQGNDRDTSPWNRAIVHNNPAGAGTLRPIGFEVIERMVNTLEVNGANVTAGYIGYPLKQALVEDALRARRYSDKVTIVDGYKAYDYEGLPLFVDMYMVRNAAFIGDESTIKVHHVAPLGFFEINGDVFGQVGGDYARTSLLEANMIYLCNLACDDPSKWGRINDLEEPYRDAVTEHVG